MAKTYPVTDPSNWSSIFSRLGLKNFGAWFISDTVQPVSIVDSEVTLTAIAAPPAYGTPATTGEAINPAAGQLLADTGALAPGNYFLRFFNSGTANAAYRLHRRNAANAADIWAVRFDVLTGIQLSFTDVRFTLAANERFTVESIGALVGTFQASLFFVLS